MFEEQDFKERSVTAEEERESYLGGYQDKSLHRKSVQTTACEETIFVTELCLKVFFCVFCFTETVSPTVFPLVQCAPGTSDKVTVGCLAYNFYPKSLTFQWTDASGSSMTSVQYPSAEKNNSNTYTGVSLVEVSKSDWNSRKSFTCSVTHSGSSKTVTVQNLQSNYESTIFILPCTKHLHFKIMSCVSQGFFVSFYFTLFSKTVSDDRLMSGVSISAPSPWFRFFLINHVSLFQLEINPL